MDLIESPTRRLACECEATDDWDPEKETGSAFEPFFGLAPEGRDSLTESVGVFDDYSSSHRKASAKFLNLCGQRDAISRLALRIASRVSGRS